MSELLKLVSLDEARQVLWHNLKVQTTLTDTVETKTACGRVLAEPVIAQEFLPAFTRSSMDGYAIKASDSGGAVENSLIRFKIIGEITMGEEPNFTIHHGETALIHTGGMIPNGADAVVPLEIVQVFGSNEIALKHPVSVNENILLKGEDVKPGDQVVPSGRIIRPEEIGGLLALGLTAVKVARRPRVAILSSGDEVIPPEQEPKTGQVRDINTWTLAALVEQYGGEVITYPIIPDRLEQMEREVRLAFQNADLVIITAGTSVSARDMTATVVNGLGLPGILVHGISIRPGKPTILAVCDGKPVIGLPGNPVSALVIAHLIVKPLLLRLQGMSMEPVESGVRAVLSKDLVSQKGRENWIPVKLKIITGQVFAEPIQFKSNLIFQLTNADGLVRVKADVSKIPAGINVDVTLI